MSSIESWPVVIIGAGAAGLHCAAEAGLRGCRVLLLERGRKPGRKILISGGGRCNFTNLHNDPRKHYLSANPHFCISALKRYPASAFIELVEQAGIAYHEKTLGQLFCDGTAGEIVDMLLRRCRDGNVTIRYNVEATKLAGTANGFRISVADGPAIDARQIVVATGGLSIPKLVTDFAFRSARELDLDLLPLRAGLVPFTWNNRDRELLASLSGISLPARACIGDVCFDESLLFTHRGLSGPVMLQISSYWQPGQAVSINLLPNTDLRNELQTARQANPRLQLSNFLNQRLPARLVETIAGHWFTDRQLAQLPRAELDLLEQHLTDWQFVPGGTEGYRTAEVTLGGVDTDCLSSRTLECKAIPGLYFIGEAVDVTGHLGGHNFQWAWASAYAAAEAIAQTD